MKIISLIKIIDNKVYCYAIVEIVGGKYRAVNLVNDRVIANFKTQKEMLDCILGE